MNNSGHVKHNTCGESGWNCSNSWCFPVRLLSSCLFKTRNRMPDLVVPFVFLKRNHSVIPAAGRDCTDRKSCVIIFSGVSTHSGAHRQYFIWSPVWPATNHRVMFRILGGPTSVPNRVNYTACCVTSSSARNLPPWQSPSTTCSRCPRNARFIMGVS